MFPTPTNTNQNVESAKEYINKTISSLISSSIGVNVTLEQKLLCRQQVDILREILKRLK